MTPSKDHEPNKSFLGCLLEAYALERGIDLSPYGSWTLKSAPRQSGAEPDECYLVGADQGRDRPDLAIEVDVDERRDRQAGDLRPARGR